MGFLSIAELQRTQCRAVDDEQGVYLVVAEPTATPSFLAESIGGRFKWRDPTLPLETPHGHWISGVRVLYIGKAGGEGLTATLRSRLKQYMSFGRGVRTGNWGGRLIWQMANSDELEVCWKPTPNEEPKAVEAEIIGRFRQQYTRRLVVST